MERPDPESLAALLQNRPLPWKKIPQQLRPGESTIEDADGRPVMTVRSNLAYHQLLLDLICHAVPAHLASLNEPLTIAQTECDEIKNSIEEFRKELISIKDGIKELKSIPGTR